MTRDTLPGEEWRAVPGYPNYEVSSLGRIWSHNVNRILKAKPGDAGYPQVSLCRDGEVKTYRIYRPVAWAFLGPRPPELEVRHINGDPLDNRVVNLRYGTQSENTLDMVDHGVHHNARKTHCPAGHPYDERSFRRKTGGGWARRCLVCHRAAERARDIGRRLAASERAGAAEVGSYVAVGRAG